MAELLVWIPLDGIGVHDKATECLLLELVCFVLWRMDFNEVDISSFK